MPVRLAARAGPLQPIGSVIAGTLQAFGSYPIFVSGQGRAFEVIG